MRGQENVGGSGGPAGPASRRRLALPTPFPGLTANLRSHPNRPRRSRFDLRRRILSIVHPRHSRDAVAVATLPIHVETLIPDSSMLDR